MMSNKVKTMNLYERYDILDQITNFESSEVNAYKRQTISKRMKQFFLLIQMIICLDFGFFEYKTKQIKFWVKLWLVTCGLIHGAIILIILFFVIDNLEHQFWGIKFITEYYFYILILMLTPENRTFCIYQMKLQHFDKIIHVESSSYNTFKQIFLYWSLLALYDFISVFIYYYFGDDYVLLVGLQIIFYIPLRAFSLPLIVLFFIFYSAYRRLEKLKIYIKKRKSSVQRALQLYRFLIDSLENVLTTFKYVLIVHMTFNVPTVIASIYILLKTIRDNDDVNFTLLAPYMDLVPIITVEVVPTVASSWLSQEVMAIQLILHNQVLGESDESQIRAMEKFITYIEARPFKFYMLTMIPMDYSLPFILFNLCVTYIIVCLQFAHIY